MNGTNYRGILQENQLQFVKQQKTKQNVEENFKNNAGVVKNQKANVVLWPSQNPDLILWHCLKFWVKKKKNCKKEWVKFLPNSVVCKAARDLHLPQHP